MRTTTTALALLLVTATSAACKSEKRQPADTAAGGTVHTNPHFTLTLPPGWTVTRSKPEPTESLGVYSDGVIALKASGPGGYYLEVFFECPGTELAWDAWWRLVPDSSGRSVARIDELGAPTCTPESKKRCEETVGPEFCYCAVGDGRLEIWAPFFDGKHPYERSNGACLHLGNNSREQADREPLRAIAMSLRIEGPVDAPLPALPLPAAMQERLQLPPAAPSADANRRP